MPCTKNLKHRTFLTTLYATGMRFSEAANLNIHDIDSQRMQIRILHGKGSKQRQVPLSPRLLCELRDYWKQYKPSSLIFPGKTPDKLYCDTSIQKAITAGQCEAGSTAAAGELESRSTVAGSTEGQPTATKLTVAQILRSQCAAYVKQYTGQGACPQVQSVLAKLSLCRTRALGGKTFLACWSLTSPSAMNRWNTPWSCLLVLALVAALTHDVGADELDSLELRFNQTAERRIENEAAPNFRRHIVPLLGRMGCNGRACHGSFQGQGGFRLSMFGFDFVEDHKSLVDSASPRIKTDNALDSLILRKPTSDDDHEGGKRFEADGWEFHALKRWIEAGAKDDSAQVGRELR